MGIVDAVPGHSIRIFSLDYSLVPEARYPTQLQQIAHAYEYLLTTTTPENIIVAGDSAGASLLLSFLLHIARPNPDIPTKSEQRIPPPASLILISPWCNIDSHHQSPGGTPPIAVVDEDFLDTGMLDEYARLYTGASSLNIPVSLLFPLQFYVTALKSLARQLVHSPATYTTKWITRAKLSALESQRSPESATIHTFLSTSPYRNPSAALDHPEWLGDALPPHTLVTYGEKEIMVDDIRRFTEGMQNACHDARGNEKEVQVVSRRRTGWHAWPMVLMYLGSSFEETNAGINLIAEFITRHHRK